MVMVIAYCGVAVVVLLVQVVRTLRGMRMDVLGALIDLYECVNEIVVLQRMQAAGRPSSGDQAVSGHDAPQETPEQWLARMREQRGRRG